MAQAYELQPMLRRRFGSLGACLHLVRSNSGLRRSPSGGRRSCRNALSGRCPVCPCGGSHSLHLEAVWSPRHERSAVQVDRRVRGGRMRVLGRVAPHVSAGPGTPLLRSGVPSPPPPAAAGRGGASLPYLEGGASIRSGVTSGRSSTLASRTLARKAATSSAKSLLRSAKAALRSFSSRSR
jgi:hypothetical protein